MKHALLKTFRTFFLVVILPVLIVILCANAFLDNPSTKNQNEKFLNAYSAGIDSYAKDYLKKIIKNNPERVSVHRLYIDNYYKGDTEEDIALYKEYFLLTKNTNAFKQNIGWYCVGRMAAKQNKFDEAVKAYNSVSDMNFPYLNLSLGEIYLQLNNYTNAQLYFEYEIKINGKVNKAYYRLAKCLYQSRQYDALEKLYEDENATENFSGRTKRFVLARQKKFFEYSKELFVPIVEKINVGGFFGALLILICWFVFLRKLDVFEPEKIIFLIITLILGMVFCVGVFALNDIIDIFTKFELNGNLLNDLFFCIFKIGMIEEFVKIIPLIIILTCTRQINESIDYIIYASLGALGFAFCENLIYFHPYGLHSIYIRGLIPVIGHMVLSSIVAYGFFYAKYSGKGKLIINVIIAFCLAAFIHGVYDFWLLGPVYIRHFALLSIVIFFIELILYKRIIIGALNYSEFWTKLPHKRKLHTMTVLAGFFTYIMVFEYLLIAWKYGPAYANIRGVVMVIISLVIAPFIVLRLGRIELQHRKWVNLISGQDIINLFKRKGKHKNEKSK